MIKLTLFFRSRKDVAISTKFKDKLATHFYSERWRSETDWKIVISI